MRQNRERALELRKSSKLKVPKAAAMDAQDTLGHTLTFVDDKSLLGAATASKEWQAAAKQNGERRIQTVRAACKEARRAQPPWYVDMRDGDDSSTGEARHPLKALDCAHELMNAYSKRRVFQESKCSVVRVLCAVPFCELLVCSAKGCSTRVCREHGTGGGRWERDADGDSYDGFEFAPCVCQEQGCEVAFCRVHESRMQSCDVCYNIRHMERSLGCYNYCGPPPPVCSGHMTVCRGSHWRRAMQQKNAGGEAAFESDDESDQDEDVECDFKCCPDCFIGHDCGNEHEA